MKARFRDMRIPICSLALEGVNGGGFGTFQSQERVDRLTEITSPNRHVFLPKQRASFPAHPLVMSRTITRRASMDGRKRIAAAQKARWPERTLAERFWAKVDRRGACWVWQAARDAKGYGWFIIDKTPQRAHRVAYELANGPIPTGLCILHSCDNPPCCNPAHLRAGTKLENSQDCVRRGRHKAPRIFGRTKPVCVRGHAFTEENTRTVGRVRYCRACARIRTAEYRRRRAVAS